MRCRSSRWLPSCGWHSTSGPRCPTPSTSGSARSRRYDRAFPFCLFYATESQLGRCFSFVLLLCHRVAGRIVPFLFGNVLPQNGRGECAFPSCRCYATESQVGRCLFFLSLLPDRIAVGGPAFPSCRCHATESQGGARLYPVPLLCLLPHQPEQAFALTAFVWLAAARQG